MNPAFIDEMSWEMAEVYGAVTDQILVNLANYFPYYDSRNFPRSALTYQAEMLAQMGQVNKETIAIIRNGLKGASPVLSRMLEQVIVDSVGAVNPELAKAVAANILKPAGIPVVAPNQMRAFDLYYQQAANKLNLVNTAMLESTKQAYQATVADIAARVQATQTALDIAAGETITGASAWNQATQHAIKRMQENGITGFIDHAGRHWSAESYVAMDVRTTMANTARAAIWETNQNFGNDLYSVSFHNGARPGCYPWQNKVISSTDDARVVADLDGYEVQVYAQSSTSYGDPAGLFGINCKHYPTPFIPGVSLIRGKPQDEEDNARTYAESQEQRRLERKVREEKRDLLMLKAEKDVPEWVIKGQENRVREASAELQDFCDQTGRARHRDREGVYTERKFPAADTYDVSKFTHEQQQMLRDYYDVGGAQVMYPDTYGMKPNTPLYPMPRPVATATQADTFNYGKPFETDGYRKPQQMQIENARQTLANAPSEAKAVWEKVADKLERPQLDPSDDGAYYSARTGKTYYKTWKKAFEQSTYQRKNAVFFHEYGHNIDNLLGGGGYGHDNYWSTQYVGKNGRTFLYTLDKEIGNTLNSYYLKKHGLTDAYDAVKMAQDSYGGMGFVQYTRQMLKGVMPGNEWRAIRDTLYADNVGDDVLRPLVDKWLQPHFQKELTAIVGMDKATAKEFCNWVKSTYSIYETTDVSDAFGNYMTRKFGHDFTHPFGVGHKASYQMDASNLPTETFAEFYSATVTQCDSLVGIKAFLPESYKFFLEMLEDAANGVDVSGRTLLLD